MTLLRLLIAATVLLVGCSVHERKDAAPGAADSGSAHGAVLLRPDTVRTSRHVVIRRKLEWHAELERNRPKPGELRRADAAYDAGGFRVRGLSDGHFRVEDMQVVHEAFGGAVIPDTLLIVTLDRRAPIVGGRFTVMDTVWEIRGMKADTTLLVRPE